MKFSVPAGGVDKLIYQGVGSQRYELYCNGRKVLEKKIKFGDTDQIDLKNSVNPGENVLAVFCDSRDYPGGWLAEITAGLSKGTSVIAVSDGNTLCSTNYHEGWPSQSFDDSDWGRARQLYRPPNGPMEHVPKEFVGDRWLLDASTVSLNKNEFNAGEVLPLTASLTPMTSSQVDLAAYIKVLGGGQELIIRNISPALDTTHWEVGQTYQFQWDIRLSEYLKKGSYKIRAGFYRTEFLGGNSFIEKEFDLLNQRNPDSVPIVKVGVESGIPRLEINGSPTYPVGFLHRPWGGPNLTHVENYKKMADSGAVFFNTPLAVWGMTTGTGFTQPEKWAGATSYDFSRVDATFLRILDQVPSAYFIPRVSVRAPKWWCDENPDQICHYADNTEFSPEPYGGTEHESFASEKWLADAGGMLKELIGYINQSPYADRVIGYQIDGGVYGEWHMWSPRHLPDTSEPMRCHFIQWVKNKYNMIDDVNKAWGVKLESFEAISCPTVDDRYQSDIGVFRDLSKSSYVPDYWKCLHETTADSILYFAQIVKNETANRALCGAFYGYLTDAGWEQEGGHLAVSKVLNSPYIDFLASPHSYRYRSMGDPAYLRAYPQSVALHQKIFIDEADTRTSLADPSPLRYAETPQDSVNLINRDFLNAWANSSGLWFFDMSVNTGWFDDGLILEGISKMVGLCKRIQSAPRYQLPREVAVICDPESFTCMTDWRSGKDHLSLPLFNEQFVTFCKMGAPFDVYLLDDLLSGKIKQEYKCMIFLNTWSISAENIQKIKEMYKKGKVFVYMYAPGFSSSKGLSKTGIETLTEFHVSTGFDGGPLASKLEFSSLTNTYGIDTSQTPRFFITDANEDEILAYYCDGSGVSAALKRGRDYNIIYSAAAPVGIDLLNKALAIGNVYRYIETEDALYVGAGVIGIHAGSTGSKVISLPTEYKIKDVISEKILSPYSNKIHFEAKLGETHIFELIGKDTPCFSQENEFRFGKEKSKDIPELSPVLPMKPKHSESNGLFLKDGVKDDLRLLK